MKERWWPWGKSLYDSLPVLWVIQSQAAVCIRSLSTQPKMAHVPGTVLLPGLGKQERGHYLQEQCHSRANPWFLTLQGMSFHWGTWCSPGGESSGERDAQQFGLYCCHSSWNHVISWDYHLSFQKTKQKEVSSTHHCGEQCENVTCDLKTQKPESKEKWPNFLNLIICKPISWFLGAWLMILECLRLAILGLS